MDFELKEEQRMLRDMVRDFARNEIEPGVEAREKSSEFPADIIAKSAELGLCGISVPEEYGGAGFDTVSSLLAIIEIASVCPSTAITLSVTNAVYCYPIYRFGNEEQKRRFLAPAARGEFIGGFALTEPDTGSDAASIRLKAVEDGEGFVQWLDEAKFFHAKRASTNLRS